MPSRYPVFLKREADELIFLLLLVIVVSARTEKIEGSENIYEGYLTPISE